MSVIWLAALGTVNRFQNCKTSNFPIKIPLSSLFSNLKSKLGAYGTEGFEADVFFFSENVPSFRYA